MKINKNWYNDYNILEVLGGEDITKINREKNMIINRTMNIGNIVEFMDDYGRLKDALDALEKVYDTSVQALKNLEMSEEYTSKGINELTVKYNNYKKTACEMIVKKYDFHDDIEKIISIILSIKEKA